MKKYRLKTIKEITEVVDENNVVGFLKDFEIWLKLGIATRDNKVVKFGTDTFLWNDDDDWGAMKEIIVEIKKQ